MYKSAGRLPQLLSPQRYYAPEAAEAERRTVFARAWRLVATTDELAKPGDFVTRELSGQPVVVRNFAGKIQALSNVCAHRHCIITRRPRGHSDSLRCQYHGWEYGADGLVSRVPEAHNFEPFGNDRPGVKAYPTATCGALVFAALGDGGPTLKDFLGPIYETCQARFGSDWRPSQQLDVDVPANWKVAVENSLESYHVPQVHPQTFGADPGDERSEHELAETSTTFVTKLPFTRGPGLPRAIQAVEAALVRALGGAPTAEYRHVHVFPNLLFSFTDFVSLVQAVEPAGPSRSLNIVRQYGLGRRGWWFGARAAAAGWRRLGAGITRQLIQEDLRLFADVQRGLVHSRQPGVLGRCEERIHAFQRWLLDQEAPDQEGLDAPGNESR